MKRTCHVNSYRYTHYVTRSLLLCKIEIPHSEYRGNLDNHLNYPLTNKRKCIHVPRLCCSRTIKRVTTLPTNADSSSASAPADQRGGGGAPEQANCVQKML